MGFVTVRRTWCEKTARSKERTKGKKIRRVPLNAGLRSLLVRLRAAKAEDGFVLPRRSDFKHASRTLGAFAKRAGVKRIRFHDLRHTFAALWMMGGGDVYRLQKALGPRA